jgi:hypothetical protein
MPEPTRLKKLSEFSQEVRDLLTSELTVYYIDRLNTQNNIPEEKEGIITKLIARLVLGLVPAQAFTTAAQKELNTDAQTALRVSREVRDTILAPIAKQLLQEENVDLKKIAIESAPAAQSAKVTPIKTNPLTTVNLKTQPRVSQPTAAERPIGPVPQARVIQFKPAQAKPQSSQDTIDKKPKVLESESPCSLKEEPPQA